MSIAPVKVMHLIAEPRSWCFFDGQAAYYRSQGFEFHAACSPGPLLEKFGADNEVVVYSLPITRRISVGSDLVSIWCLLKILRRVRPLILHAHFSKTGMIGMLAGFLARTPIRIYHNHGMALSSAHGLKRAMLWTVEKLTCLLAHRVIYVAPSVMREATRLGVCNPRKARAILSANGLDFSERFSRLIFGREYRDLGRRSLQIPEDAFVVGFVGRIFKVKGIEDLVRAWQLYAPVEPRLHLVMVGAFDPREPIAPWAEHVLRSESRIHLTGFVEEPATKYPVMDVVVLPSYHEGLGYCLVEAAAMELPVIGTRIPGIVDAIQENVNGVLIAPGKPEEIVEAIRRYANNPALATEHGKAGREFVVAHFRRSDVWNQIRDTYIELISLRNAGGGPR
jgi:glycosyltransferase involved in cell wall biosynthesis